MRHLIRAAVAFLVAFPITSLVVALLVIAVRGPEVLGGDDLLTAYWEMLFFYGGYGLLVAILGTIVHTRIVEASAGTWRRDLLASALVGIASGAVLGLFLGLPYIPVCLLAGVIYGAIYGMIFMLCRGMGVAGARGPEEAVR